MLVRSADERVVAASALEAAEEQLQSLTASHAGTFVSVERRSTLWTQNMQSLLTQIDQVSKHASESQKILEQGDRMTENNNKNGTLTLAELSERHRVRRRTLLQHGPLLELLELPSLMDACVRSNLYEEALQIAALANTLSRRHASETTPNPVVHSVIEQIRSRQDDLRRHLVQTLRTNVTMPECLEVVTAVRRLNAIDLERLVESAAHWERTHTAQEYQLQVAFLEARDVWLDSKSSSSSSTSSAGGRLVLVTTDEALLDAIERYRTRVFEIMSQFNAIFCAQKAEAETAAATQLLALWTSRRVHTFLQLLSSKLTDDAAACRDALEASVFFAVSLGRLGADFTAQLPLVFEPLLLNITTRYWKEGVAQLKETLAVCREAGIASPLASSQVASTSSDTDPAALDDNNNNEDMSSAPETLGLPQPPPKTLLRLPPLARLVNAVLNGLNELRRCLLPGTFPQLRVALDEQLQSVAAELLAFERAVHVPGLRGEAVALRHVATELQSAFALVCEPYLHGSLEAAMGDTAAAARHHTVLWNNMRQQQQRQQQKPSDAVTDSPPATSSAVQVVPTDPTDDAAVVQNTTTVTEKGDSKPTPDGPDERNENSERHEELQMSPAASEQVNDTSEY